MIGLFPVPLLKIKFKDHYKYNFPEVEKKDKKPDTWTRSVDTTFPFIEDDDPLVPYVVRESLKKYNQQLNSMVKHKEGLKV